MRRRDRITRLAEDPNQRYDNQKEILEALIREQETTPEDTELKDALATSRKRKGKNRFSNQRKR